jgi:hypothetical protein
MGDLPRYDRAASVDAHLRGETPGRFLTHVPRPRTRETARSRTARSCGARPRRSRCSRAVRHVASLAAAGSRTRAKKRHARSCALPMTRSGGTSHHHAVIHEGDAAGDVVPEAHLVVGRLHRRALCARPAPCVRADAAWTNRPRRSPTRDADPADERVDGVPELRRGGRRRRRLPELVRRGVSRRGLEQRHDHPACAHDGDPRAHASSMSPERVASMEARRNRGTSVAALFVRFDGVGGPL